MKKILLSLVVMIACVCALYFILFKKDDAVMTDVSHKEASDLFVLDNGTDAYDIDAEDTQQVVMTQEGQTIQDNSTLVSDNNVVTEQQQQEKQVEVNLLSANTVPENKNTTKGIDVSKYQGSIDFKQVAAAGIDFVMVRVGYRDIVSGIIEEDPTARYNMQEASNNGIKVGVYFFSSAISDEEAIEEADFVLNIIDKYPITYPVVYDCERFDRERSRQYNLSGEKRTNFAITFMNRIYENGYTPMFYGAKNEMEDYAIWDMGRIENKYKVWVAHYKEGTMPDYSGRYDMWQYSCTSVVSGISEKVDMNLANFGYDGVESPKNSEAPTQVKAHTDGTMKFNEVNEVVTAKEVCKLRNMPNQDTSEVKVLLQNGQQAVRIGISDSGWSKVVYEGQTLYVVSSLVTTDLNYKVQATQQVVEIDDGLNTKFKACNDNVTAKIETNLRTLPSVTNPDSQVVCVLHNGEYVLRTGINEALGWSRVELNGQVLYCVSSYLKN